MTKEEILNKVGDLILATIKAANGPEQAIVYVSILAALLKEKS